MRRIIFLYCIILILLFSLSYSDIFSNFHPKNVYFILSGVYNYSISSMDLPSVKNDLNNIDVIINNLFDVTKEIHLVNLGKDVFVGKLTDFLKKNKPSENDLVIFYFAGHGTKKYNRGILLLNNANGFEPDYGFVYTQDIADTIKKTGAKLMMIMDACDQAKTRGNPGYIQRVEKADFYIAASAKAAYSKGNGGVLTSILCKAFNPTYSDINHDMKLTYAEIKSYIINEVNAATYGQQIPYISSDLKIDIDFSKTYGVLKFNNDTDIKNEFVKIISPYYNSSYVLNSKSSIITLKSGRYKIFYSSEDYVPYYSYITIVPGKILNLNAVKLKRKPKHIYINVLDYAQNLPLSNVSISAYSSNSSYEVSIDENGDYVFYFNYKKDMPIHLMLQKMNYKPMKLTINVTKAGFSYKGNFIPYDKPLSLKMRKRVQSFNLGVFTGRILKCNDYIVFPSVGSLTDYKTFSPNDNDPNDGIWMYNLKTDTYIHDIIDTNCVSDTDPNQFEFYNNKIFFTNQSGILYCFDLKGKKIWNKKLIHPTFSKPLIIKNDIFVTDEKGVLYKISLDTGNLVNKAESPLLENDEILSSPVFYNDNIVFISKFGTIFEYSRNLELIRRFQIKSSGFFIYNPVNLPNNLVFISANSTVYNRVSLIQIYIYNKSFKLLNFSTFDFSSYSPPGIYYINNKLLIAVVDSGAVKIYNSSFNLIQNFPIYNSVLAAPLIFKYEGRIYVAYVSMPSNLYLYSIDGTLISKSTNGLYSIYLKPYLNNSTLYLVNTNGKIYSKKIK